MAEAVVVTGASTGIGAACALELDRRGYRVFAGVRREADGLALQERGTERLTPVLLDVTNEAQIKAAAETVRAAVGAAGLAGLVNNAGVATGGPLEFLPLDELRRQLEINVVGVVAVTQAFLPLLRQGRGRIVNIGSSSGRLTIPFMGPYSASKFALGALNDALRLEVRAWGIRVILVEPASVATPIWDKSKVLADDLERRMPPEAHTLYGPVIARFRKLIAASARHALPVEAVTTAVVRALTAPNPKTRYIVGRDTYIQAILGMGPDWLRDRLVARVMRLPAPK
jgi:NAD(P)-dependent dehydrogenase (short-subunit alcohol dehydrogenase family)